MKMGFQCDEMGTKYTSLLAAQTACSVDQDCGMIYDDSCDGGNVTSCPSSATIIINSTEASCLYIKGKDLVTFNS